MNGWKATAISLQWCCSFLPAWAAYISIAFDRFTFNQLFHKPVVSSTWVFRCSFLYIRFFLCTLCCSCLLEIFALIFYLLHYVQLLFFLPLSDVSSNIGPQTVRCKYKVGPGSYGDGDWHELQWRHHITWVLIECNWIPSVVSRKSDANGEIAWSRGTRRLAMRCNARCWGVQRTRVKGARGVSLE